MLHREILHSMILYIYCMERDTVLHLLRRVVENLSLLLLLLEAEWGEGGWLKTS